MAITEPAAPPKSGETLATLCLQYLLALRICTLGSQVAAIVAAYFVLTISPPIAPVLIVMSALSIFTLVSWRHIKFGRPVSDRIILVQLLVDVLGLATLLYFTGGSANPFASLLLLPVIVAAALLRPGYTWLIAAEAALCYTLMMVIHVHPATHWSSAEQGFQIHLWGMWFGFMLSAGVVAYFVARMGGTLRAHDRELAQAREKALQANQVIALGTLAAGTAHELGTPLATMAILAKELEHDYQETPGLTHQLRVLREQINRCKDILSRMAARAGQAQAHAGRALTVPRYLDEVLTEWRQLRPNVPLEADLHGPAPGPRIIADRTLSQALLNVLSNAADANARHISLAAEWDDSHLRLTVQDDGQGLPDTLREHLGQPFVTTKPPGQGMGLGLYLARTTLERLGGTLTLSDGPEQGACARITLPLAQLTAA
jgi:two-component system sensor histidine kinase RegB